MSDGVFGGLVDAWQAVRAELQELENQERRFKYPDIVDRYGRWWYCDSTRGNVSYQHDCMILPAMFMFDWKHRTLGPPGLPEHTWLYGLYGGITSVQPTLLGMPLKRGERCHYCLVEVGSRDER